MKICECVSKAFEKQPKKRKGQEGTYKAVAEGNDQTSDIAWVAEYTQRHQRVTSVLLLAQDEQTTHHNAENDQTDDLW